MKIRMNIAPKLTLVFVLFAAALLASVSTLTFTIGSSALESAALAELSSTAIEKHAALEAWVTETEIYSTSLSFSPYLRKTVLDFIIARETGNQAEIQDIHDRLVAELQVWMGENHDFQEWMILDPQSGQIIVSTNPNEEGKFRENQPFFIFGKENPYFQNLYYSTSAQRTMMTVSAPILSENKALLGVLAGNLDLQKMSTIISRRSGQHQSDDAFIVNKSELLVTQPRFITDPAVLQRGIHTQAVKQCLAGSSGVLSAIDYRGVPSLIVYNWLSARQLCLIVKMDQAEALRPVLILRNSVILIGSLTLLVASLIAWWLARAITRPIHQLAESAHEIGAGKLDTLVEINTGDEIGALAATFSQMARNIQKTLVSRDDLVKEIIERKRAEDLLRKRLELLEFASSHSLDELLQQTLDQVGELTGSPIGFYHFVASDQQNLSLQAWSTRTKLEFCKAEGQGLHYPVSQAGIWANCIQTRAPIVHNDYASEAGRKGLPEGHAAVIRELVVPILRAGKIVAILGVGNKPTDYTQEDIEIVAYFADIAWESAQRKQADDILKSYSEHLQTEVEQRTRELQAIQEKLVRQERLATLGQLAGSVSHELRNPLGVISNAIYFLKAAQPDASMKVKEYLDIIEKETFTSDKIVTDLLDFTRIKSVDRQSITVPDLIRQVLDRYPAPLPVEVALDLPTGLPAVYVDQRQIIQVLGNLVDNACQSMMSSSSQEQAEPTWAPKSKKLTISAVEQTDMICINIIDTGTGISPENMDNLFEPLFSTKTKGIGLGLAISKKLAEANGGRIEVQSKPGTGSTFSLYLPVNNSKVVPAPAQDKDLK